MPALNCWIYQWIYVIYKVLKNRYYPASSASLQESIQRAHDRQSTAYKFGELVDRHGGDSWIVPLIDDLGPFVQLQLGDMANLLEVLTKSVWLCPFKKVVLLIHTQLLRVESPPKNCGNLILAILLSSHCRLYRYGILHKDFRVPFRRGFLPLLAHLELVSQISIFSFAIQVGLLGHSDRW